MPTAAQAKSAAASSAVQIARALFQRKVYAFCPSVCIPVTSYSSFAALMLGTLSPAPATRLLRTADGQQQPVGGVVTFGAPTGVTAAGRVGSFDRRSLLADGRGDQWGVHQVKTVLVAAVC